MGVVWGWLRKDRFTLHFLVEYLVTSELIDECVCVFVYVCSQMYRYVHLHVGEGTIRWIDH